MKAFDLLFGIVARFFQAARIEKREKRSFGHRKLVSPRITRAWPEALADFGLVGARQVFDDARFAALGLAEEPKHRNRRLFRQLFQTALQLAFIMTENCLFDRVEHRIPPPHLDSTSFVSLMRTDFCVRLNRMSQPPLTCR